MLKKCMQQSTQSCQQTVTVPDKLVNSANQMHICTLVRVWISYEKDTHLAECDAEKRKPSVNPKLVLRTKHVTSKWPCSFRHTWLKPCQLACPGHVVSCLCWGGGGGGGEGEEEEEKRGEGVVMGVGVGGGVGAARGGRACCTPSRLVVLRYPSEFKLDFTE